MQSDHRLVAQHWLRNADADLRVCHDYIYELPPVACFHAQQASEKALKGVLTWISGDSPRSHIADLLLRDLEKLGEQVTVDVAEAARSLDKHYAPTRYPDALGGADPFTSYTSSEAKLAWESADNVVRWARTKLI